MTVVGIGVDLIKIQRVREALERAGARFLEKVFTREEIELASKGDERAAYFATRFAAKESILKAFCTGWIGVKGTDIHIEPGARGEPLVKLSGELAELASQRGVARVLLSLSYDSEYAVAMCILLGSGS